MRNARPSAAFSLMPAGFNFVRVFRRNFGTKQEKTRHCLEFMFCAVVNWAAWVSGLPPWDGTKKRMLWSILRVSALANEE